MKKAIVALVIAILLSSCRTTMIGTVVDLKEEATYSNYVEIINDEDGVHHIMYLYDDEWNLLEINDTVECKYFWELLGGPYIHSLSHCSPIERSK